MHSLSHATGRLQDLKLHHGTLNAIYLPGVLRFSDGSADEKYARLREAMGLPTQLGPMGLNESHIGGIAEYAESDLAHFGAPKKPAREDYERLVREVL